MKKIHVLGIALVAMLAFNVMAAVSASAATLQWLAGGKAIASPGLNGEVVGEITLGSTNGAKLKIEAVVLCSGIFTGSVGPGPEDIATGLLNLAHEPVTPSKKLLCPSVKTCEGNSEVVPVNLPWLTRLELMGTEAEPLFLDVIEAGNGATGESGNPGYEIKCKTALATVTEKCTAANLGANVTNDMTENDVLGIIEKEVTPPFTCNVGGANTGFVETGSGDEEGLGTLNNKEPLSVSYE
jgi:hypothetical protein